VLLKSQGTSLELPNCCCDTSLSQHPQPFGLLRLRSLLLTVSLENSGPFLRTGEVLVAVQWDTSTISLLKAEQAVLVRSFLPCESARFDLLHTVHVHFLLLQNFKFSNPFPLSRISEALPAQAE